MANASRGLPRQESKTLQASADDDRRELSLGVRPESPSSSPLAAKSSSAARLNPVTALRVEGVAPSVAHRVATLEALLDAGWSTTDIVTLSQIKPISVVFSVPQQQLARVNAASAGGTLTVEAISGDGQTVIDNGTLAVVDNQVDLVAHFQRGNVRILFQ